MKLRYGQYSGLIILGVFLVAFLIFYGTIDNHVYVNEFRTVNSMDATLPVVSFRTQDAEINRTLGLTFIPQEGKMRTSITPVSPSEKTFEILIDQKESNVRKLTCTVSEVSTGLVLDNIDLMSLKHTADGRLVGQVFLQANYATDTEYTMRVTLTTGEGKTAYYYTRLFLPTYGSPKREVEFLEYFHKSILDDEHKTEIEKYLESEESYTGADFSRITHRDSVDSVGYGQMSPTEIDTYVPTFVEYTTTYVAAEKEFYVQAYSNDGLETYSCVEHYRFRAEQKTNYLYSFERKMEVVFEPIYFNMSQNQIKLGITGEKDLNYLLSKNNKYMTFVRDGDLWEYDMDKNVLIPLFSFDREGGDNERYHNSDHDFKLISISDNGDADFVFYGYIVRGEYEGRVGILYYRYYAEEERVEELMFVPVTVPYDILKEEFGGVCYMNRVGEFFFTLYGTLYRYRTSLHDQSVLIEELLSPYYFVGSQLIYQERDNTENTRVCFYDFESNSTTYKEAAEGDLLLFIGSIDGDLIYGDAHKADVTFKDNGKSHVPMYKIRIETLEGEEVKSYQRENESEYFLDAVIENNGIAIDINRKERTISGVGSGGTTYTRPIYAEVGTYNILKSSEAPKKQVALSYRNTEPMRREYYLNLPTSFKLTKLPEVIQIQSTQGSGRIPVRLGERTKPQFYVEAFGEVIVTSYDLAECISKANANYGGVFNEKGEVVWMRGMRANFRDIRNVLPVYCDELVSEREAILQMFLSFKGAVLTAADCDLDEKAMLDWITDSVPGTMVDLTGITVMEMLNFVSDGHIVATIFQGEWFMITGYSANLVVGINPAQGRQMTISLSRFRNELDNTGLFYTYID